MGARLFYDRMEKNILFLCRLCSSFTSGNRPSTRSSTGNIFLYIITSITKMKNLISYIFRSISLVTYRWKNRDFRFAFARLLSCFPCSTSFETDADTSVMPPTMSTEESAIRLHHSSRRETVPDTCSSFRLCKPKLPSRSRSLNSNNWDYSSSSSRFHYHHPRPITTTQL